MKKESPSVKGVALVRYVGGKYQMKNKQNIHFPFRTARFPYMANWIRLLRHHLGKSNLIHIEPA